MLERFCLNAATIKATPLERQIELAAKAGFPQIGLWNSDVDAALARGESLNGLKRRLDDIGLRVGEFCFLPGWMDADEARLKTTLAETRRLSEMTRALGCDLLVTIPSIKPGFLDGASDRFRQVCEAASEFDVRVALEFPGIAAEINNLRAAHDLVSAAGAPNGGLIIDTFHFTLGGSKIEDFSRRKPGDIILVHVSDALDLPMEKLRIPHDNRTFPGEGTIDYRPIFSEIKRLQYSGPISLEVWNSEYQKRDPEVLVRRGADTLQSLASLL
jgi:sugar phosphate isomerase/epimerase